MAHNEAAERERQRARNPYNQPYADQADIRRNQMALDAAMQRDAMDAINRDQAAPGQEEAARQRSWQEQQAGLQRQWQVADQSQQMPAYTPRATQMTSAFISDNPEQDIINARSREDESRRAQQSAQQARDKQQYQQQQDFAKLQSQLAREQQEAAARIQDQYRRETEARRAAAIPGLMAQLPSINEASYAAGTPELSAGELAGQQAQFSRAREQVGKTALGAVRGLREATAGQGLHGSTIEAAGIGNILGDARGTVGDVSREQAIQGAQRLGQIKDRDVQTGLARRGQDVAARNSAMQALLASLY